LLLAVELVSDAATREPFPADARIATRVAADAAEAGVMTYPIQGCVDGTRGDHILIAPPFTINSQLIGMLVEGVERAVADLDRVHAARLGGSSAHN
jgi:adenosylmethionine-8-amino-7-oxononanoate aminotransferase